MPVVNREVVLPVERERAWELITEPAELESWLADEVEFEPEEGAPLRVTWTTASARGRRRGGRAERADRLPLGRLARRVDARRPIRAARASSSPSTASRADVGRAGARAAGARRPRCAWPERDETSARCSPRSPTRRAARSCARSSRRPEPDRLAAGRRAADHPPGRRQAPRRARARRARRAAPRGPRDALHAHPAPLDEAMAWMARVGAPVGRRGSPGSRAGAVVARAVQLRRRRRGPAAASAFHRHLAASGEDATDDSATIATYMLRTPTPLDAAFRRLGGRRTRRAASR